MRSADPQLIRLVTGRYRELQGLFTIADAGLVLVIGGCFGLLAVDPDPGPPFVIATATLEFGYLGLWLAWILPRLKTYYNDHFGRAHAGVRYPVASYSMSAVLGIPILADMHVPVVVRIAFAFLVLSAYPTWTAVRDWPHRSAWLMPAIVGALSAVALAPFGVHRPSAAWQGIVAVSFAGALMTAGLFDHLLLVRVLRGTHRPDTVDVHE